MIKLLLCQAVQELTLPTSFLAIPIAKNWEVDISGSAPSLILLIRLRLLTITNEVFRIAEINANSNQKQY
jgi:hypothetical protein